MTATGSDDEWVCPKPDCVDGIDDHDLARILDHIHWDEPAFTEDDAQQVADRTITRLEGLL